MLYYTKALYQVMRDAKLERPELDKLVFNRLEQVLISAYLHVPYYRKIMESSGYNPIDNYRGPEDLLKFPITTKKTLKERKITEFVQDGSNLSNCFSDSTSGSSGIPIRIYRSSFDRSLQIAKWLRVLFVNGYSIHHKVMSPQAPGRLEEGKSIIQKFGLLRRLTIDYLHSSPEQMVDAFLSYRPDVLYGNRSHIDLMALELKRRNIKAKDLKLLVATAEVIHDNSRQLYKDCFGLDVIESYGSVEMGVMAYETKEHDGLHLCEDLTYFEFLDENGKPVPSGQIGRVVVTDLTAKLMPFIRYDQGDLSVFTSVDKINGSPTRRLTEIVGRDSDFAVLPDGTKCPLYVFSIVIKKFDKIMQFQVIQKSRERFQIMVVADDNYLFSVQYNLIKKLKEEFPESVSFEVIPVDQINPDSRGKIKLLVSEVE